MEGDSRTQHDGSAITLQGWESHGHGENHGGKMRKIIKSIIFRNMQTCISSAFPQNLRGSHVRNFQNTIPCLLRVSYVHVFGSLRLNKWNNFRLSKGYYVTKYKKFLGSFAFWVRFTNFSACFTSTQRVITCSKLTIETLEQGAKYVQS